MIISLNFKRGIIHALMGQGRRCVVRFITKPSFHMYLTDHYQHRLQSFSAELDATIVMRLEPELAKKYTDECPVMSIEQKIQVLKIIEENIAEENLKKELDFRQEMS